MHNQSPTNNDRTSVSLIAKTIEMYNEYIDTKPNQNWLIFKSSSSDLINTKIEAFTASKLDNPLFDFNFHTEHIRLFLNHIKFPLFTYKQDGKNDVDLKNSLYHFFGIFFNVYFQTFPLDINTYNFETLFQRPTVEKYRTNFQNLSIKDKHDLSDLVKFYQDLPEKHKQDKKGVEKFLIFYYSIFVFFDYETDEQYTHKIPEISYPEALLNTKLFQNLFLNDSFNYPSSMLYQYKVSVIKDIYLQSPFYKFFSNNEIDDLIVFQLQLYNLIFLEENDYSGMRQTLSSLRNSKHFDEINENYKNKTAIVKNSLSHNQTSLTLDFGDYNLLFDDKYPKNKSSLSPFSFLREDLFILYTNILSSYDESGYNFLHITTNLDTEALIMIKHQLSHSFSRSEVHLLSSITLSLKPEYLENLTEDKLEMLNDIFSKLNRGESYSSFFDFNYFPNALREISIILQFSNKIENASSVKRKI